MSPRPTDRVVRERLRELVALDTTSPMDDERLARVIGALPDREWCRAAPSLVVSGEPSSPVWVYTHLDTKPAGDPARWASPPLELAERDGRWYGLGISDAKFQALNVLLDVDPQRFFVLVDCAEETGSPDCARWLAGREIETLVIVDGFGETGPQLYRGLSGQVDGVISLASGRSRRHPARSGGSGVHGRLVELLLEAAHGDLRFTLTGLDGPSGARSLSLERVALRFDIRFGAAEQAAARAFVERWDAEVRQWMAPVEGRDATRTASYPLAPFSCGLASQPWQARDVVVVAGGLPGNDNHQPDEWIYPWQVASHSQLLAEVLDSLERRRSAR